MRLTLRTRAELFLLLMTLVWGSTFVLTKFVLEDASPFAYVSVRFAVASVLLAAIFFRRVRKISKDAVLKGGVLGILLFVGFVLQTIGLKYTTASKSAFVTGLMVIFTPFFQLLIEHKSPKMGNIVGVIFVAAGLFFLTSPQGSEFNIGDVLTLLCAVLFSIYTVYLGIFGKEHDPAHLTFMQFVSTALLSALALPLFERGYINMTGNFIVLMVYLAVMPTVVALYIMAKYQKDTTPTRSAVIYSMEPPFAALFAFFIIGETMGISGVIGGMLILLGLIVSELSDNLFKRKKPEHLPKFTNEIRS
jgi:drug/metabolite transporter (DMT)-like permease